MRGQSGQAQTAVQELAKAQAAARQPNPGSTIPAYFTNAMAQGMSMAMQFRKKEVRAKVARMTAQLHLTDDQAQSISNLMTANIEASSQRMLQAMSGGLTSDAVQAAAKIRGNEQADIKALLNPDQLAAYPDYLHSEALVAADNSAKSEVTLMAGEMDLTNDQQEKVRAAIYQYDLNRPPSAQNKDAIAQARASGNLADAVSLSVQTQKQELDDKLKLLDGILTPDQLATYKQKQQDMMDMQTSALKMFLPSTNAVTQANP